MPEKSPPMLLPPMKMLGSELDPVISSRAALFIGSSIKPGSHSLPRLISLKRIPADSNSAVASVQKGDKE